MRVSIAPAVLVAALAWPAAGIAQTLEIFPPDRGHNPNESPQHFLWELRGGPWFPAVDSEFSGSTHPYRDMFGTSQQVYLGTEVDWQILRINPVGSLGLGLSIGYTNVSAIAPLTLADGTSDFTNRPTTGQSTSLTVLPMSAVGVLRIDGLARNTVIPLVPYVKAGLAYSIWWVDSGSGRARVTEMSPGHPAPGSPGYGQEASGATLGVHLAAGLMLRLDMFEPRVQSNWDEEMGINHSYLFFEWAQVEMGGLGSRPQLNVGSSNWVVGIALEF